MANFLHEHIQLQKLLKQRLMQQQWTNGTNQLNSSEIKNEHKTACLPKVINMGTDDATRAENIYSPTAVAYKNR